MVSLFQSLLAILLNSLREAHPLCHDLIVILLFAPSQITLRLECPHFSARCPTMRAAKAPNWKFSPNDWHQ